MSSGEKPLSGGANEELEIPVDKSRFQE